jgi:hypothetical protein
MVDAETFIAALQRLFPSLYYTREKVIEHLLIDHGTGYAWVDGAIEFQEGLEPPGLFAMIDKIKDGTAPSVHESLLQQVRSQAYLYDSKSLLEEDIEKLAQDFMESDNELFELPPIFRISRAESPICNVPDEIRPDWVLIAQDALDMMARAKIDFNDVSILPEKDQARYLERKNDPVGAEEKTKLACEELGIPYCPTTDEAQLEWETYYSPMAKAKQANALNNEARDIAIEIRTKLGWTKCTRQV